MSELKTLTLADIESVNDVVIEAVPVPEWGGQVFVRSVDSSVIDAFEARNATDGEKGYESYRARLVALCACDAAGNKLFTEKNVAMLARKSAAPVKRLALVAARLNRIGAAEVEDAKKNSASVPSDASP